MIGRCLALLALVVLAGCGGGSEASFDPPAPAEEAEGAEVVRAWAAAVREGDIDAANELFAVPATVTNGTPPVKLRDAAAVNNFNRSLPCGAEVLNTQVANGGYIRATFKLVTGAGGTPCEGEAEVSFRIEDGRITEWLRESTTAPPNTTET